MKNVAVIDIGSNSIKLVLVRVRNDNSFKIIYELKETVRLGKGMTEKPVLREDRMKIALQTLKMFKNLCDATDTKKIIAVATAAVRNANNQEEFLQRVKKETDLSVRVLSGSEEGYFDYWGVVNSIEKDDGLIMDIGGGSVELIWMENRQIKDSVSLPFGALDLTQQFDLYDEADKDQIKDLEKYLEKAYKEVSWLSEVEEMDLIGVGGTIRNIAKIDKRKKDYPLDMLHYYRMEDDNVQDVYDLVKKKDLKGRKKISGLSKKRADIFIGASAIIATLMNNYDINNMLISGKGIREGLIYKHLNDDDTPTEDVLDFSIQNVLNNFNVDIDHAQHVHKLTRKMFNQLKPLYETDLEDFDGNIDNIVKTAALLHDCGRNINYYDHHEHSYYIILNSGINGLSHRELLITAYIAASHRHTKYSLRKYNLNRANFKDIISKDGDDKEVIRKTGILLEIAESLDRNLKGFIEDVNCEVKNNRVTIKVITRANEEDIELEINDAMAAADGFKKLYDKYLVITK